MGAKNLIGINLLEPLISVLTPYIQTNNTALQISIWETELEAAHLQAEYDALDATHP
jgi:hypothetical protein